MQKSIKRKLEYKIKDFLFFNGLKQISPWKNKKTKQPKKQKKLKKNKKNKKNKNKKNKKQKKKTKNKKNKHCFFFMTEHLK